MKTLRIILLTIFTLAAFTFYSSAQEGMEDVLYLKNGNVYRGLIVEQVPGDNIKIRTIGGNVFTVQISEILKITKEDKIIEPRPQTSRFDDYSPFYNRWHGIGDSSKAKFRTKKRGYFFQSQLLIENIQGGIRIINGYKFNRLAQLGVGIGTDFVFSTPLRRFTGGIDRDNYSGAYFPLYLYFAGDFFNRKITPYYAFEAGYAWTFRNSELPFSGGFDNSEISGGAMGSAGLGLRFHTKRRINFSLLFNVNFKQVRYNNTFIEFDPNGNPIEIRERRRGTLVFPGIRFGIGF